MGKRSTPYVSNTERTLTDLGLQSCSARPLPPYSVILSSRAPIGHLVINVVPMATNQGCKGLVPSKSLDHKFLFYFLGKSVELLNDLGTGATFKELSGGKLKEVTMPLPPLPEQQRIVALLDDAFDGIATAKANAEQNLKNAREIVPAMFAAIFEKFCASCCEKRVVSEIAHPKKGSIRTGPFGSQLLHTEFVEEGIAVLGIDNAVANEFRWGKSRFITPEKYAQLTRYKVNPGDVIITIMGTCGRCAVVPNDIPTAINTKHLCCITLNLEKCLPEFLHSYFLYHPVARDYLERMAKGSIMAGLNMGIIQELPVLLPSVEQQASLVEAFSMVCAETQRLESIYQQKLAALDELKKSLLHKAFSGEL